MANPKSTQSLLPPGANGCASVSEAMELILSSFPAEFMDTQYMKACENLGLDPLKVTIGQMLGHTLIMKGLTGDVNAIKAVTERTDGKVIERLAEDDPIKMLTDKELDILEGELKLLEDGK